MYLLENGGDLKFLCTTQKDSCTIFGLMTFVFSSELLKKIFNQYFDKISVVDVAAFLATRYEQNDAKTNLMYLCCHPELNTGAINFFINVCADKNKKINFIAQDKDGKTALHYLLSNEKAKPTEIKNCSSLLIKNYDASLLIANNENITPLELIFSNKVTLGFSEEHLINYCLPQQNLLIKLCHENKITNAELLTALFKAECAKSTPNPDVLMALVKTGKVPPDSFQDKGGKTYLFWALVRGQWELAKCLLTNGASPTHKDNNNRSIFLNAILLSKDKATMLKCLDSPIYNELLAEKFKLQDKEMTVREFLIEQKLLTLIAQEKTLPTVDNKNNTVLNILPINSDKPIALINSLSTEIEVIPITNENKLLDISEVAKENSNLPLVQPEEIALELMNKIQLKFYEGDKNAVIELFEEIKKQINTYSTDIAKKIINWQNNEDKGTLFSYVLTLDEISGPQALEDIVMYLLEQGADLKLLLPQSEAFWKDFGESISIFGWMIMNELASQLLNKIFAQYSNQIDIHWACVFLAKEFKQSKDKTNLMHFCSHPDMRSGDLQKLLDSLKDKPKEINFIAQDKDGKTALHYLLLNKGAKPEIIKENFLYLVDKASKILFLPDQQKITPEAMICIYPELGFLAECLIKYCLILKSDDCMAGLKKLIKISQEENKTSNILICLYNEMSEQLSSLPLAKWQVEFEHTFANTFGPNWKTICLTIKASQSERILSVEKKNVISENKLKSQESNIEQPQSVIIEQNSLQQNSQTISQNKKDELVNIEQEALKLYELWIESRENHNLIIKRIKEHLESFSANICCQIINWQISKYNSSLFIRIILSVTEIVPELFEEIILLLLENGAYLSATDEHESNRSLVISSFEAIYLKSTLSLSNKIFQQYTSRISIDDTIKFLCSKKFEPGEEKTALMYLVAHQHINKEKLVKFLSNINDGKFNAQDKQGNTALHYLLANDKAKLEEIKSCILFLVKEKKANLLIANNKNIMPLEIIFANKSLDFSEEDSMQKILITLCQKNRITNAELLTALFKAECAKSTSNPQVLIALVKTGKVPPDSFQDKSGKTYLFWALVRGQWDLANRLLTNGASPTHKDKNNRSIFLNAILLSKDKAAILKCVGLPLANELLAEKFKTQDKEITVSEFLVEQKLIKSETQETPSTVKLEDKIPVFLQKPVKSDPPVKNTKVETKKLPIKTKKESAKKNAKKIPHHPKKETIPIIVEQSLKKLVDENYALIVTEKNETQATTTVFAITPDENKQTMDEPVTQSTAINFLFDKIEIVPVISKNSIPEEKENQKEESDSLSLQPKKLQTKETVLSQEISQNFQDQKDLSDCLPKESSQQITENKTEQSSFQIINSFEDEKLNEQTISQIELPQEIIQNEKEPLNPQKVVSEGSESKEQTINLELSQEISENKKEQPDSQTISFWKTTKEETSSQKNIKGRPLKHVILPELGEDEGLNFWEEMRIACSAEKPESEEIIDLYSQHFKANLCDQKGYTVLVYACMNPAMKLEVICHLLQQGEAAVWWTPPDKDRPKPTPLSAWELAKSSGQTEGVILYALARATLDWMHFNRLDFAVVHPLLLQLLNLGFDKDYQGSTRETLSHYIAFYTMFAPYYSKLMADLLCLNQISKLTNNEGLDAYSTLEIAITRLQIDISNCMELFKQTIAEDVFKENNNIDEIIVYGGGDDYFSQIDIGCTFEIINDSLRNESKNPLQPSGKTLYSTQFYNNMVSLLWHQAQLKMYWHQLLLPNAPLFLQRDIEEQHNDTPNSKPS